ncbi:zinc finger protein 236-like isoform X2 [Belonocnema kinseyi]|uniref:zinc finger protein 236-like isoform X2 n=1 Tax=Belonocnema kinseyi TaxID=2817044 RepID=UPI00143E0590|nr:zinc finger protein 236-like isoform X2 [Belonocnema kinseyi]
MDELAIKPEAVPEITELLIKIDEYKKGNAEFESSSLKLQEKLNIIKNEKCQIESDFRDYRSEVAHIMRETKNSLSEKTAIIKIFGDKVEQLKNEIKNIKVKLFLSKSKIQNTKIEIEKNNKVSSHQMCQTEFETIDKVEYNTLTAKHSSSMKEKQELDRLVVAERSQIINLKEFIKNATDAQRKLNSTISKLREESDRQQTFINESFMEICEFIKRKKQKLGPTESTIVPEQMKSDSKFQMQKVETPESETIETSAQFHCDMCKKGFETKGRLYTHIHTVHVEETSPNWFKCDVCRRRFISKGRIYNHIHSVHSKMHHKCEICNTEFSSKGNCLFHIRTKHKKKEIERIEMKLGKTYSVRYSY